MPQLGESIAEATVVTLKVKPGETVVAVVSGGNVAPLEAAAILAS